MTDETRQPEDVQLVCTDLMFTSKVTSTGREFGRVTRVYPTAKRATEFASTGVRLALLDLANPKETSAEDIRAWRDALPAGAVLAAYGSHVEVDRLKLAKEAGCDQVFVRSEFVRLLPMLLRGETDLS